MEPDTQPPPAPDETDLRRAGLVVERITEDRGVRLRLDGDLDLATGPMLTQLTEVPAGGLVVDMGAVRFLDAAGIRALVALAGACDREGQRFVLSDVGRFQRGILELLDLTETLGVAPPSAGD